jgi:peptidoglycan/LPS O-acetylase OafA/YrhL
MAAELSVVHIKIRHRAAGLTPPAVATQDLLAQRSELTGWPLVANFATRRIFRIYPLIIIAVLTALALHLDSDVNGIRGLSYGLLPGKVGIASNLLLIQNLTYTKSIVNVLWSLPFELQMYAFLPFIFAWIRGKRMFWPLLGLRAASSIAGLLQPHVHGLGRLSILAFVPNFLPGVIAFSLPYVPRFKSFLWPAFILALVAVFTVRSDVWVGWVLCLLLGIMIPSFAEIKTRWLRRVSNRIATYSYGIYHAHQFCIWIALATFRRKNALSDVGRLTSCAADRVLGGDFALVHSRARGELTVPA